MDVTLLTELQFGFDKGSPIKSPKKGLFRFSEISLLFAVEQALFVRILQASEGKRKASEEHQTQDALNVGGTYPCRACLALLARFALVFARLKKGESRVFSLVLS